MKRELSLLILASIVFVGTTASRAADVSAPTKQVVEAAKREGEVVLWSNSFEEPEKVLKPFYALYPFLKVKLWDGRSEEIINKIITEARAGRYSPDVLLLSTRAFPAIRQAGLLQEYDWPPHVNRWPEQPKHRFWRNTAASPRIPSYNTRLIPQADVPKSWDDLKSPKWQGKSAISSSGADAPLLFADLWKKENGELNWEKSFAFWREVIQIAKPKVVRGFTGAFENLAAGDFAIFLLSSANSAIQYMQLGAPVRMAPVGRTVGSAWGIAVPQNLPHPNATRLFVNWILSPEGLIHYADLQSIPLIDPEIGRRARANITLKELGIDWYPIADEFRSEEEVRKATVWWSTELGVRRGK
ncbi:MAG TPA: extracellular solute-binding protein [Candidatus Acidoferrales bacterium]|nr:extracellular solute-binding protein [Candidatus Acidoferrales bacterium]